MPITVACTCGKSYPVKEEFAGQQVQCPDCGAVLTIPGTPPVVRIVRVAEPVAKQPSPPPPTRAARRPSRREHDEDDYEERPRPRRKGRGCGVFVLPCLLIAVMLVLLGGTLAAVFVVLPLINEESKQEAKSETPSQEGGGGAKKGDDGPGAPPPPVVDATGAVLPAEKPPPSTGPWKGHTAAVRAVGFSVDGQFALSGSGGCADQNGKLVPVADNSIRFWDAASGREHRLLDGFPYGIASLAFTPDARYAVIGGAGQSRDGRWFHGPDFDVHLYDLQAQREVRAVGGHTGDIFCVAVSTDGRRALTGGGDHTVRFWDLETGKQVHCLKDHSKPVYCVAMSPDGNLALSGGADQQLRLWDLKEGIKVDTPFAAHKDIVWAVAFSPDGKQAASAGGRQADPNGGGFVPGAGDFVIRLWDIVEGKVVRELRGHTDWVGALAFSRDGKRLLSGGQDAVRLWQVSSGEELAHFEGHTGMVRAVAFSPNERRALSGGDNHTIYLWDLPLTVRELIRDLRGTDVRLRLAAVHALGRAGPDARPAVPDLLRALTEKDQELRTQALASLNRIGPPEGSDVLLLLPVLREPYPEGRRYALESLSKLGAKAEPAAAALADVLKDRSAAIRIKTAELLGAIGPPARDAAWKPLLEVLRDADPDVSAAAGAALARLGSPGRGEVGTLKALLAERGESPRRYGIAGLTAIGPDAAEAVPALLDVAARDQVADLRRLALAAVQKIQPADRAVVAACTRALADSDPTVCEQAVQTLAAAGPRAGALPGLLQALEHRNPKVVKTAADSLQAAKLDKSHVPSLEQALKSKSPAVRLRAIEALGRIGADAAPAVLALCELLKDAPVDERRQAVVTLGQMGPAARAAGPRLAELLKDKDPVLAREASVALVQTEAAEVEQAVPQLVKALKIDREEAAAKAGRDRARKMLVRIGKPALHGLVEALDGEFLGGRRATHEARARAAARLTVVQTLEEMGPKANTLEVQRILARLQGKDPVPAVRAAAKQARARIQSGP